MLFISTLIILFAAPVAQAIYSNKRINETCKLSLGAIGFYTFLLGIALSIPGVFIFISLLPANIRCATGAFGLPPMELMILLVTTPVIYWVYKIRLNHKSKKAL